MKMLKEKYILVEYDGDGYGATVYTMALMTEKEWSIIEKLVTKKLGGRSSDTYDSLRNIVIKRRLTLLELNIKVKITLATRIYSIVLMIVMLPIYNTGILDSDYDQEDIEFIWNVCEDKYRKNFDFN